MKYESFMKWISYFLFFQNYSEIFQKVMEFSKFSGYFFIKHSISNAFRITWCHLLSEKINWWDCDTKSGWNQYLSFLHKDINSNYNKNTFIEVNIWPLAESFLRQNCCLTKTLDTERNICYFCSTNRFVW